MRVGYVYDSFVVSGNQRHSLGVSLSLPLALFDHGQAGAQAAQARAWRSAEQHRLTLQSTQVRADSRLAGIPIIMITSRVGEKHRARAIEIGVDDYLGKPYQEAQLLEAIEPLIARRREAHLREVN